MITPHHRVAIVGSGIAGLGCAYFLHQAGVPFTVFEAGAHIGGHSNTITVMENTPDGPVPRPIDTGFMVFNTETYPYLIRLFAQLQVPTKPTDMSFSVQHCGDGLEWSGQGWNGLFAQRKNLVSARHWRMLLALHRFADEAESSLNSGQYDKLTIGQYVAAKGYPPELLHHFLLPMSSAIWSTHPEQMTDFPVRTLLRFFINHRFMRLHGHIAWQTVDGGAQEYVKRLIAPFRKAIHTQRPVTRIVREAGADESTQTSRVWIHSDNHSAEAFDAVILAAHADESLALLDSPTGLEERLLKAFPYQPNTAILHSDSSVMPRERRAWSAWNYRLGCPDEPTTAKASTHYWMNRLQGVSDTTPYFVSINGDGLVNPVLIHRTIPYTHPIYALESIPAQRELPELNANGWTRRTFFAGSYFRYGFHEDAFGSAVQLCRVLLGNSQLFAG